MGEARALRISDRDAMEEMKGADALGTRL